MMKYEIENRKFGSTWVNVIGKNAKGETMTIEIVHCTNPGGSVSLPYAWYKNGWTDKVMETWLGCTTYVHDSEDNCRGAYNPTEKYDGKRNVINFDWLLEDTEENTIRIIKECIRQFESATGKSATELKIERIIKNAKERGLEVVTEMPEGWKESHCASNMRGSTTIVNTDRFFKRENGKLMRNPEYKQMLLIL